MDQDARTQSISTNDKSVSAVELDAIIGDLELDIPNTSAAFPSCFHHLYCV